MRKGPSSFRFENMWLKEDDFKELLRNWWMVSSSEGLSVLLFLKS